MVLVVVLGFFVVVVVVFLFPSPLLSLPPLRQGLGDESESRRLTGGMTLCEKDTETALPQLQWTLSPAIVENREPI